MKPLPLVAAAAIAGYLVVRRRRLGRVEAASGALVALACLLVGLGAVRVPNVVGLVERVGTTLGPYTYAVVGLLTFLETGAFIGFVAPGETAVLVGGVVAGQGEISPIVLVAIVWACAVGGDLTSYALGRRLGRGFMLRHGARLKIDEDRLDRVEGFFERRGAITIVAGRFVGVVRPLMPFIAGSSRLPLRRFVPYDIVGSGLWAATFVGLGYVFWRSLDTVTTYVGRGLLVFSFLVALVVGGVYARRLRHDAELRATVAGWLRARPPLRPLLRLAGPARFAYDRLTPGQLGLELITLLALAGVGGFGFFAIADAVRADRALLPGDGGAFSLARTLGDRTARDVVAVLTGLGSIAVVGAVTAATALWAAVRRRIVEATALVAGLTLTFVAVRIATAAEGRRRPLGALVEASAESYPSDHTAYAVGLVACAVVLVRSGSSLTARSAVVGVALCVVGFVALSRVYLRADHLSDVLGGLGIGTAVFATCGIAALLVAHVRHNPSP